MLTSIADDEEHEPIKQIEADVESVNVLLERGAVIGQNAAMGRVIPHICPRFNVDTRDGPLLHQSAEHAS